jgi:hypothetical protein
MNIARPVKAIGLGLLALVLFVGWFIVASDYGYGAVSGAYSYRRSGESSTLLLNRDKTFFQQRIRDGQVERAKGTWRRIGEGGIVFSPEFLPFEDARRGTDGEVYADVQKRFLEMIPCIVFDRNSNSNSRYDRVLFRFRKMEMQ